MTRKLQRDHLEDLFPDGYLGDAQIQSNRLGVRTVDLIVMPTKVGIHDYVVRNKKSRGCRPASA
jgi:hypothetical protein